MDTFFPDHIWAVAQKVITENARLGRKLATAESCTGGLVSAALTEIAGSSAVFEYGFVTYANEAKNSQLGVPEDILADYGAVSEETVRLMAFGALRASCADAAVAISGIAGPGGGTSVKPVGTIVFALGQRGQAVEEIYAKRIIFGSNLSRSAIRTAAAAYALELLLPPNP
ncbi:MAG: CinA family protein [Sphingomonadales bacterium]|nr:CinA family protein [Sphingomonadales bacterium]